MNAIVKQKQQAMFELLDRDGDGVVSMNEFNRVLSVTITALPEMQQIITNSLDDFFKTLNEHLWLTFHWWDDDQNGSLTWSELQDHGFDEVEIRHFLELYDRDDEEEDQENKVISKGEFLWLTYEKIEKELRAKKEASEIMWKLEDELKFLTEFSSDLPDLPENFYQQEEKLLDNL